MSFPKTKASFRGWPSDFILANKVHSLLIWLFMHHSVQTGVMLHGRGINIVTTCILCNSNVESQIHLFRDCQLIVEFGNLLVFPHFKSLLSLKMITGGSS